LSDIAEALAKNLGKEGLQRQLSRQRSVSEAEADK
jgi:hypothetical protein